MEYLPSGVLCRGSVTRVHDYGFEASCRVPSGSRRFVHAEWQPGDSPDLQGGRLTAHA